MATPTTAYIATINPDHTIVAPDELPVGATVAIIMMADAPSTADNTARRARFEATLAAIRDYEATPPELRPTLPSDMEIDALIKKARKDTGK